MRLQRCQAVSKHRLGLQAGAAAVFTTQAQCPCASTAHKHLHYGSPDSPGCASCLAGPALRFSPASAAMYLVRMSCGKGRRKQEQNQKT